MNDLKMEELMDKADLYQKENVIKKHKIESEFERIQEKQKIEEKFEEYQLNNIKTHQETPEYADQKIKELERNKELQANSLVFINNDFSEYVKLYPGGIYLMGAVSGTGKSSNCAAIAYGIYETKKKVFIISTEESSQNILARLACIDLKIDFNDYINNPIIKETESKAINECIKKITPYITIFDDNIGATTIETIEQLFYQINESNEYSCVIIDFAQRVNKSKNNLSATKYDILYRLKDILTDYAQHGKVPIILMSQLKPLSHVEKIRNVESRIKLCTAFYEAAACVIEIIRLPGIPISLFHVEKARFGRANITMIAKYDKGRFIKIDKRELKQMKDNKKIEQINSLEEIYEDVYDEEETKDKKYKK